MPEDLLKPGMFDNEEPVQVATAQTPTETQASPQPASFDIPTQNSIPSTTLANNISFDDVRAELRRRQQLEQNKASLKDFNAEVSGVPAFDDPEGTIKSILYGDQAPTALEKEVAGIRSDITDTVGGIDKALTSTRERAERTQDLTGRESLLAETNNKIAARQARFRRELRAFEQDAERRGVDRAFYQDEKTKLEADATAELADLYIVQQAQQGNVDSARAYIDTAVNNRYRSIEIELAQKQAELAERIPLLEAEEKEEAQRLQLALQQRAQNIAIEREDAKTKRELAITAASNGAGSAAISAITNASNVDNALAAAAPFIGLLERQAAARAASNAALQRRASLIEMAKAGDANAIKELGAFGQTILQQQTNAELLADYQRNLAITDEISNVDLLLDKANSALSNDIGKGLATGAFTSPAAAAYGTAIPTGLAGGAAAGSVVPGLGTMAGGVLGTIAGAGVGTVNYAKSKNAKENFLNDVAFIAQNVAFDKFIDLKSQGVAFGGTSNAELKKIDSAASALSASLIIDPISGQPIRISGDDVAFAENLAIVTEGLETARTELQKSRLSEDEQAALLSYISAGQ